MAAPGIMNNASPTPPTDERLQHGSCPQALNQNLQSTYGAPQSRSKQPSPKDAVGASLQAAFNAAAAAAASVAAPFASWGNAAAHTLPVQAMTSQLQGAAAAGQTTAVATMATVSARCGLPGMPHMTSA